DDIAQTEYRKEIAEPVFCHTGSQHHHEVSRMPSKRFHCWIALDLSARDNRLSIDRRLGDTEANENAYNDQKKAGKKGQTPAPAQEIFTRQRGHERECASRQKIANGNSKWRESSPEPTMPRRRVLDEIDDRTTIFCPSSKTLNKPHRDK